MSDAIVTEEKKSSTLWCPVCQSGISGLKPSGSWRNYTAGDECPLCIEANKSAERKAYMNNMDYTPQNVGTLWEAKDWEAEVQRRAEVEIEHRRRHAPKQIESPDLKIQKMKVDHEREMSEMRAQMDNLLNEVQKAKAPVVKPAAEIKAESEVKEQKTAKPKDTTTWEPVNYEDKKSSGSSKTLKGGK